MEGVARGQHPTHPHTLWSHVLAAREEAGIGRIKPRASTATPGTLDLEGTCLLPLTL